jgi:N-acetyl-beta-hexosaminidase
MSIVVKSWIQEEAYKLQVNDMEISIVANDAAAVLHAFETLSQLIFTCPDQGPHYFRHIPIDIEDKPAFPVSKTISEID